jgi:hypothetical protein
LLLHRNAVEDELERELSLHLDTLTREHVASGRWTRWQRLPYAPRPVSPDGRFVIAIGPDQKAALYPLAGGDPQAIPGLLPGRSHERRTDALEGARPAGPDWRADGIGAHSRGRRQELRLHVRPPRQRSVPGERRLLSP